MLPILLTDFWYKYIGIDMIYIYIYISFMMNCELACKPHAIPCFKVCMASDGVRFHPCYNEWRRDIWNSVSELWAQTRDIRHDCYGGGFEFSSYYVAIWNGKLTRSNRSAFGIDFLTSPGLLILNHRLHCFSGCHTYAYVEIAIFIHARTPLLLLTASITSELRVL